MLVFEYDGINPAIPQLGEMAEGMDYIYSINDSEIRVLIYSLEYGRAIGIGDGNLLNINCNGSGDIRLKEFSFATFHGDMMQTKIKSALVPDRFEVSQNYPNPFNPMTSNRSGHLCKVTASPKKNHKAHKGRKEKPN